MDASRNVTHKRGRSNIGRTHVFQATRHLGPLGLATTLLRRHFPDRTECLGQDGAAVLAVRLFSVPENSCAAGPPWRVNKKFGAAGTLEARETMFVTPWKAKGFGPPKILTMGSASFAGARPSHSRAFPPLSFFHESFETQNGRREIESTTKTLNKRNCISQKKQKKRSAAPTPFLHPHPSRPRSPAPLLRLQGEQSHAIAWRRPDLPAYETPRADALPASFCPLVSFCIRKPARSRARESGLSRRRWREEARGGTG